MPSFKRYYLANSLVFITTVTHDRWPIFADHAYSNLLLDTMRSMQKLHPYHLMAYAVLPDHLHFLMQPGPGTDFSQAMKSIKWNFTLNYKKMRGIETSLVLWQERFWDHIIRDQDDLNRHMDYIHYNPVKHGYVDVPEQWELSTFSFWAERGYYEAGWGREEPGVIAGLELE